MSQPIPLEVLVVIGSLEVGGTERHLCQVLPLLQAPDLHISVATFRTRGILATEMEGKGVCVLAPKFPSWLRRFRTLCIPLTVLWVGVLIARRRPDIVHTFLPESYILAGLWSTLLRVPTRVMSRRSLNYYQRKHPLLSRVEHWLHGRMHLLIGNSVAVVNDLRSEAVIEDYRIRLIYNGVEISDYIQSKPRTVVCSEIDVPDDALLLTIVANLIPYKGHLDLLEALSIAAEKLPNPWRLICIGRNDGILDTLKLRTKQLGLESNVVWLGPRSDIRDLLHATDIGFIVSHEEGLSNALLEGMAAGLPMIVTDVGGNTELVRDGITGIVVPAHTPHRLGQAISALATDKKRRTTMAAAAQIHASTEFSLERCVASYRNAYASLGPPTRTLWNT